MLVQPSSSRRQFLRRSAVAVAGVVPALHAAEAQKKPPARKADEVLRKLLEGNKRFMTGKDTHASKERSPKERIKLAEGQMPSAVIVACSDSRVAPELLFDQGLGDLFVVRVAGNIIR